MSVSRQPPALAQSADASFFVTSAGIGNGAAMLGHTDLNGPATNPTIKSWNAAHPSRGPDGGCSQADLVSTGGAGLLYCFAAN